MILHVNGPIAPAAALEGPEPEDEMGCCFGWAVSRDRCTCWEPVYDLEQAELIDGGKPPEVIPTRAKCCGDCAYRNGSPEREEGAELPRGEAREFWCHQGVRRAVAYRHSGSLREVPAGDGDYQPPIGPSERPVVWKADGSVGERCAGWAVTTGAAT